MKLQKIVNRLQKLHPKEIDLSLDRIKTLCKKLGNPQDKIKAISVVGTNGKQSTINAMFSWCFGFKPYRCVSVRNDIRFYSEIRYKETMQYISRLHDEFDWLIGRYIQITCYLTIIISKTPSIFLILPMR